MWLNEGYTLKNFLGILGTVDQDQKHKVHQMQDRLTWAEGDITRLMMRLRPFARPPPILGWGARACSGSLAPTTGE